MQVPINKDEFYSLTISNYSNSELVREYVKKLFPERRKEIVEVIQKFLVYLNKGAKILDIGSGSGKDVNFFINNGYEAQGIDCSPQMIKYAQTTYGNHFTCLDLRDVDKIKNIYDGIFGLAILQHIHPSDIDMVFSKLKNLLHPNGVLCLITKYGDGIEWDSRLGNKLKRATAFYKINELENYMAKYDFNIVCRDQFSLYRENRNDIWLAIIGINKVAL